MFAGVFFCQIVNKKYDTELKETSNTEVETWNQENY